MQGGGSVQEVEGVRRVYKQNGVAVVMFKKKNKIKNYIFSNLKNTSIEGLYDVSSKWLIKRTQFKYSKYTLDFTAP